MRIHSTRRAPAAARLLRWRVSRAGRVESGEVMFTLNSIRIAIRVPLPPPELPAGTRPPRSRPCARRPRGLRADPCALPDPPIRFRGRFHGCRIPPSCRRPQFRRPRRACRRADGPWEVPSGKRYCEAKTGWLRPIGVKAWLGKRSFISRGRRYPFRSCRRRTKGRRAAGIRAAPCAPPRKTPRCRARS